MKSFKIKKIYIFIITLILTSGFFGFDLKGVFASTTDGTIDSTYKYAWGENIGWINFGTSNGNVHITDSALSGSALNENAGWINLENVVNDGEGNLSGYGWGENIGWINFNPDNGRVIINSSGEFIGSALGENIGWIIFDCSTSACVKTDWRPQSARVCTSWTYSDWSNCSNSQQTRTIITSSPSGCSGGSPTLSQSCSSPRSSGGLPPGAYNAPVMPSGGFVILIQPSSAKAMVGKDGVKYTNNRAVTLKLNGGSDAINMAISNSADFYAVGQETYQTTKTWILTDNDGVKTIYVKFYTQYGQPSQVVSDEIILDTKPPAIKMTDVKDYYSSAKDVTLFGETEAGAEIILRWDKKYGLMRADEQGKLTINLSKMSVGKYQLEMTPTDLAGNKGSVLTVNLTIKPSAEVPEAEPEITLEKPEKPSGPTAPEDRMPIFEKVPEILKPLIPEFLKPKEEEKEKPEEMIIIPEETPLSMRGRWKLLPEESIRAFVLAPLPKEIRKLAEKFPELGETLKKVGITKITDLKKLKAVKLTLPGLTERVGLPTAKIEAGKFALPVGIPVAKLSARAKKQIPSEIVFAKTGGELIDFNITLSITEKGEPQQKISTISGKPLQLIVKPDKPVKSVKGYLVFKSKKPRETSFQFSFNHLAASLIFANPVLAKPFTPTPNTFIPVEGAELSSFELVMKDSAEKLKFGVGASEKPVRVEEKLVLLEFEYTDPDGDGIYTAEIQAPMVDGEYEIITVMDYEDPELGKKEIRLITVVDPEGYVYEKDGDRETRVPGAIISLFWLNSETKQYELWPAKEYQQENPQTTDVRGTYSFLVPEGYYYLKAETPGYLVYDGKPFQVKEGSGVHINIELKTKYWWLKIVDWKTILLAVVIILLLYNFYRDKIREKLLKKSKIYE